MNPSLINKQKKLFQFSFCSFFEELVLSKDLFRWNKIMAKGFNILQQEAQILDECHLLLTGLDQDAHPVRVVVHREVR